MSDIQLNREMVFQNHLPFSLDIEEIGRLYDSIQKEAFEYSTNTFNCEPYPITRIWVACDFRETYVNSLGIERIRMRVNPIAVHFTRSSDTPLSDTKETFLKLYLEASQQFAIRKVNFRESSTTFWGEFHNRLYNN